MYNIKLYLKPTVFLRCVFEIRFTSITTDGCLILGFFFFFLFNLELQSYLLLSLFSKHYRGVGTINRFIRLFKFRRLLGDFHA